ncbi:MAG: enoyl-CoA hydratase-related protein [Polyangia bacterium]
MNDARTGRDVEATVRVERRGRVHVVMIERNGRRNAFDDAMIERFREVLGDLAGSSPRAAVLASAGQESFSAGYDIRCIDPSTQDDLPLPDERFARATRALESLGCPVVAALEGDAFGGGLELAAACDLRVAAPEIRLAMTPVRLGLVYNPAGIARFLDRFGGATTRRLFLTAEPIGAEEALRLGLVDEIVPAPRVLKRAIELAGTIAGNAPLAVRGTLAAIRALERRRPLGEEDRRRVEELRRRAWSSADLRRALEAFAEKKKPDFRGQ